ncbi:MAG TPA: DEAD/DEAH box helicase, partial [Saprospiraceae bacterium]|nr:DEAD/DEAH box helicase [Saprospiraceae bacterium]
SVILSGRDAVGIAQTGTGLTFAPMTFDDLNLSRPLLSALRDLNFTEPTPIQHKAFSVILSGRDAVGIAQTGTGKTFAYLLPILRQLTFSQQKEPRVLILVPTRELVVQLVGEIQKLTAYMSVRTEGVYGGTNINTQKERVGNGVDILVATPGRLVDLAMGRFVSLRQVRQLVIDEVDEMMQLGFRAQLTTIFDLLPRRRQNLMFSATMTEEVDDLIQEFFNHPLPLEVTRAGTPLERIRQSAYRVPNFYTKVSLLEHLLDTDPSMQKVLIFCPSKRAADLLDKELEIAYPDQFEVIHSNKSQNFRLNAVTRFERGECRGLIATDVLARGIDLSEVSHVICMDTPAEPETYIHRIGRTGRADRDGVAVLFVGKTDGPAQAAIEALMGQPIPLLPLPEEVEVAYRLTDEEKVKPGSTVDYLPAQKPRSGGFQQKADKNRPATRKNRAKTKGPQRKKR